jgi:hypothetical protein
MAFKIPIHNFLAISKSPFNFLSKEAISAFLKGSFNLLFSHPEAAGYDTLSKP